MKKIGIITLNGNINYGNRLQNYALQETLKEFDYVVETLWISNDNSSEKQEKMLSKGPKDILKKLYKEFYLTPLNKKREKRFESFSRTYIKETNTKISIDFLPNDFLNQYDYFVTGSDQVWNPYFTNTSPLYFLTFAPRKKRIAYAPSFGISEIPKFCKDEYTSWLSDMEHLSVREDAGAKIIKELTGRTAEVVADPTFLLSREAWLEIAKSANNKPKDNYLLTYFLGTIPEETKKIIQKCSEEYNLKIINLARAKHREYYYTDPAEFLDYINSANIFFTDSFHGTVFSILFETPFIITDRKGKTPSMNSRIQTLLAKFKLEKRHISRVKEDELFNIDFSHVELILDKERKKAKKYLHHALK